MIQLVLCILFNTLLGVIFKYFNRFNVNLLPAIVINYFVCVLTGSIVSGKLTVGFSTFSQPYFLYCLVLGFCFVMIFQVVALTVASHGVMVASIFQKMSLVAPTIIAILFFGESLGWMKAGGILSALLAIIMITYNKKQGPSGLAQLKSDLWYPLATFLGSCVIDVGLFLVDAKQVADGSDPRFVSTLYMCAGLCGLGFVGMRKIQGKLRWRWSDILAGIVLGVPNFFSIYFLLKLLKDGWDGSVVFPINNVGILTLSALIGLVLFSEKLTAKKAAGIALSIFAILLISKG